MIVYTRKYRYNFNDKVLNLHIYVICICNLKLRIQYYEFKFENRKNFDDKDMKINQKIQIQNYKNKKIHKDKKL